MQRSVHMPALAVALLIPTLAAAEIPPAAMDKAPYPAVIKAVYAAKGGQALFLRARTPSAEAAGLLGLVSQLPIHALDPADYPLPRSLEPKTDAEAAAVDVALTSMVVQWVLDHRFVYRAHPVLVTQDVSAMVAEKQDAIVAATVAVFPNVVANLEAMIPNDPRYVAIQKLIPRFTELAARWKEMPTIEWDWRSGTIEKGNRGGRVRQVQKRLKFQGYYDGEITGELDDATMAAVTKFQSDHQLDADGRPGKSTFKAMNVTMKTRLGQLKVGLHRLREHRPTREGATTYIDVNLPGFTARLIEDGKLTRQHRVVVGNNKLDYNRAKWRQGYLNRTPLMKTRLIKLVMNPIWIIPKRIADAEVTESRAKAKGYRKVSSSKGEFLIQGPGARNALGRVKFLLEKTNAIYLHDTDKPWAFDKAERALSHGCMRVHKALDLAKYVATTRAGLDDDRFSRILDSGNTRVLELEQPITVYTDYNTVGLSDAGEVIFYEDIYGYDKAFWRGKLPPRGWTRFGSPAMKPRKVPRIPFKQYLRLKREGGAAPMKWPPEDHTRG